MRASRPVRLTVRRSGGLADPPSAWPLCRIGLHAPTCRTMRPSPSAPGVRRCNYRRGSNARRRPKCRRPAGFPWRVPALPFRPRRSRVSTGRGRRRSRRGGAASLSQAPSTRRSVKPRAISRDRSRQRSSTTMISSAKARQARHSASWRSSSWTTTRAESWGAFTQRRSPPSATTDARQPPRPRPRLHPSRCRWCDGRNRDRTWLRAALRNERLQCTDPRVRIG